MWISEDLLLSVILLAYCDILLFSFASIQLKELTDYVVLID